MTDRASHNTDAATAVVDELIAVLERGRRFVLLGHVDPDLDSVGSQLALADVLHARGKHVRIWSPAPLPEQYGFLPGVKAVSTAYPRGESFDVAVALDTATLDRLGEPPPFDLADFGIVVNVDHHGSNERFGALNWVEGRASCVGEMLFDLFERWGIELSRDAAVCLYTSILSDTGGFAYTNTTARAFEAAAALVGRGVDPFAVWRCVFGSFPERRHRLLAKALGTLAVHEGGRIATIRITQQMLAETGAVMDDTERFVFFPRTVRGVDAAAVLREQPGGRTVRVGLRSSLPALDVSRVAHRLGGGGHALAAACTLEGTLDEAERAVVAALADALKEAERST
jgi:phosphoesterase RecJ-like protein